MARNEAKQKPLARSNNRCLEAGVARRCSMFLTEAGNARL
jgi:hypothetical protein